MASVIKMPRFGDTMEEGQLVRWLKEEGDEVEAGEAIAEVETDKATLELESFEDGVLRKRLVEAGTSVVIGAPVAILAEDEDDDISDALAEAEGGGGAPSPSAPPEASAPEPTAQAAAASAPAQETAPVSAASPRGDGRVKASPLARKMASELKVDLSGVTGSGPGGRIIARDIDVAAQAPQAAAPSQAKAAPQAVSIPEGLRAAADVQPLNAMRKTIARRMVAAKQAVPHFYLTMDIDMGPAAAFRAQLNTAADGEVKISYNDLIVKASALALIKHPWVNASFGGDEVLFHPEAHVGVAVALDGGLITPVVRSADKKSLGQIAREIRELATRAQAKKLHPDEYTGGTFSVSNLGMYGIREFIAIIDPPQAAILAVGGVEERAVVVNGELAVGKRMSVTLSCDHRVVDGATGAEFLGTLRRYLENPMLLVL